ncbi:TPA_asm: protein 4 [Frullania virus 1]|uniref:Protein 4 n=1 Tax=Frullania virus 1 TaxID=2977968 RepID=A0A9N7AB41_9RHAB|nr:TPA_asm: protein 4 [Frullania virus 1]
MDDRSEKLVEVGSFVKYNKDPTSTFYIRPSFEIKGITPSGDNYHRLKEIISSFKSWERDNCVLCTHYTERRGAHTLTEYSLLSEDNCKIILNESYLNNAPRNFINRLFVERFEGNMCDRCFSCLLISENPTGMYERLKALNLKFPGRF